MVSINVFFFHCIAQCIFVKNTDRFSSLT